MYRGLAGSLSKQKINVHPAEIRRGLYFSTNFLNAKKDYLKKR